LLINAWLSDKKHKNLLNLYRIILILSGFLSVYKEFTSPSDSTPTQQEESEEKTENDEENEGETIDQTIQVESKSDMYFENVFISEYLSKYQLTCENTTFHIQSLLITWIFKSILNQVCFKIQI
jgi:hypothetical protein